MSGGNKLDVSSEDAIRRTTSYIKDLEQRPREVRAISARLLRSFEVTAPSGAWENENL